MATAGVIAITQAIIAGAAYLAVSRMIIRRPATGENVLARFQFSLWWGALGISNLMTALLWTLYLADSLPVGIFQTASRFNLVLIMAGLWGLLSYLVYLYRGNRRWQNGLTVGYIIFYLALDWAFFNAARPDSIIVEGLSLQGNTSPELSPGALLVLLGALLLPQLMACVAFMLLIPKMEDATQKYRIGLVAGGILIWFSSSFVAAAVGVGSTLAWQIIGSLLGVAAAIAVLAAYAPPRFARQKWNLRSIRDEVPNR